MKTILIIQARMGSTRLPGKILLPLGNSTVLDYVVARCKQAEGIAEVIVATSLLEQDLAIVEWCLAHGVAYFQGSEDDVLARYVECAKAYNPDYVIRVTSDCPFIDYEIIGGIVNQMKCTPCDLITLEGELPCGFWSEIVSFDALSEMYEIAREPRHREHVTYFAYEQPERYRRVSYSAPSVLAYPEYRITLDTPDDYELLKRIANRFPGDKLVSGSRIVSFLSDNPDVVALNAHIQQKPVV